MSNIIKKVNRFYIWALATLFGLSIPGCVAYGPAPAYGPPPSPEASPVTTTFSSGSRPVIPA